MKSVYSSLRCAAGSLFSLSMLLLLPSLVQAEANFLGNIPAGTSYYPAIAKIGVDIPTTFNQGTKEFDFDGIVDYTFEVTGEVQIWRSGPLDNFNDPITGAPVGSSGDGLNTLRLEMVKITNVNITNPAGAQIASISLGDGVTGGTNSGAFFSTGGAAEIGPNGFTANAFLNLFMNIDVLQPVINVPAILQGPPFGFNATYPIGSLHNNSVLHLEAVIDEFAPDGISFLQTGGPVGFFAPTSNAFVQKLNTSLVARPLTEMRFAQFITTDIQIVPEPSSIVFGIIAVGAFGTLAWRRHRATVAV